MSTPSVRSMVLPNTMGELGGQDAAKVILRPDVSRCTA